VQIIYRIVYRVTVNGGFWTDTVTLHTFQ